MKRPNLFIVGFGRSGSTSLYNYLAQHPQIYMSPVKEPKYFCGEMLEGAETTAVRTLSDYLALFDAAEQEKVLGEASTMYILSDLAAQRIHEFNPNSKIVVLLRDPVDFLQSWHSLGVRDGYETEPDLMRALALEKQRIAAGGAAPHGAEISYRYRHVIHHAPEYVQRWYDTFGRAQVKPIVFDDLSQRTEEVYRDLLTFLDVATDSIPDFKVYNSAQAFGKPKAPWLDRLLGKPRSGGGLQNLLPNRSFGIRRALRKLNTKQVQRQVLAPGTRQQLVEEFTPIIQRLERIVERDLSAWYRR